MRFCVLFSLLSIVEVGGLFRLLQLTTWLTLTKMNITLSVQKMEDGVVKCLLRFHHFFERSTNRMRSPTKKISLFLHKSALNAWKKGYSLDEIGSILQISVIHIRKILIIDSLRKNLFKFQIKRKRAHKRYD